MSQKEELTDKEQIVSLLLALCAIVIIFIVISSIFFPAVEYDEQCLSYRTYPVYVPCINTVNIYVPKDYFETNDSINVSIDLYDSDMCTDDVSGSVYYKNNITEPVIDYVFDGLKTINMLNLTWDLDDCIIDKDREK